jgi:thiol-disulfide isomerase/thioredoxin/uncharacterized membrane protein YphA (DoxX/SURF4 family)
VTIVLAALVFIGRLVLAAVFAVAGLTKLADRQGTRTAVVAFGAPQRLAGALAIALPIAELVVAGLLLPASTAANVAPGAVALLVIFSGAIAWNLARGRSPECHCFGQLHSAPAGRRTLARNGALAGLALAIVVAGRDDPGPGAFAWSARMDGVEWLVLGLGVALAVVLIGSCLVVTRVLRKYGRVLVRLDAAEARLGKAGLELDDPDEMPQLGLEPGTPAPAFWLPSTDGGRVALGDLLRPGRPLLLLFTSPACGSCSLLMPDVARWQRDHADELTIAVLSAGDHERIRAEADEYGLDHVLIDETLSAYEAYAANGTPSAVLLAGDGTVASWLAAGGDWIETLVDQAVGLAEQPGLSIGSELPSLRLETPDGVGHDLAELLTGPTVVLFWNPRCGYCRAMHGDVIAWERERPDDAPRMIVVSSGAADDVRVEGFASRVLLDPEWTAATALGAGGTPMALLIDEDRRVASPLVTGAAAVLELLGASALPSVG